MLWQIVPEYFHIFFFCSFYPIPLYECLGICNKRTREGHNYFETTRAVQIAAKQAQTLPTHASLQRKNVVDGTKLHK